LRLAALAAWSVALLAGADPALLRLLPPDARLLAGVDLDQVRATPFGQALLARIETDQSIRELAAATGVDLRRDLHQVLLAGRDASSRPGLLAARGTFDPARIAAAALTVATHGGIPVFQARGGHALALLDGQTAVAGDPAEVRAALDRRAAPATRDAELAGALARFSASQHIWLVSTLPLASLKPPPSEWSGVLQGDVLKKIARLSGGIRFGPTVQITVEALTGADADAAAVADALRFLGGLAQMKHGSFFRSLEVRAEGPLAAVTLAIPEEQFVALMVPPAPRPPLPPPR
jgi:hypothetical protein